MNLMRPGVTFYLTVLIVSALNHRKRQSHGLGILEGQGKMNDLCAHACGGCCNNKDSPWDSIVFHEPLSWQGAWAGLVGAKTCGLIC
ncbi:hypothetical protein F5Y17DRAFT_405301 [Xylariaceae sp. FL0594]|nr:hypothetical protein F5Y17DRAFT_405301 [Xylariaceae sp. FL0594]